MLTLSSLELIYLGVWAFIGSVLGFFAFSYTPERTPLNNFFRGLLSVGVGMFIAFPLWAYFEETRGMSRTLSMMFGGLGAFGLPDFIMKWWPRLAQALGEKFVDKSSFTSDEAFSKFSSGKYNKKG